MSHHTPRAKRPSRKIASKAPCAFCGSHLNFGQMVGDWHGEEVSYFVCCAKCSATGPKQPTIEKAVIAWESRATPEPLTKEEAEAAGFEAPPEPVKQDDSFAEAAVHNTAAEAFVQITARKATDESAGA